MRDTVHQVLVEGVADGVVGTGLVGRRCAALGVEDGGFAVGDGFNKFLWFVDAVIHTGKNHRLTVKTGGLDVFVRCNDDAVTGGNLLDGQHIFRAVRAVGLHLGGQAQTVTGLGQRLGGHVGVCDAVGAGGHSQHAVALLGDLLLGEALLAELGVFLDIDGSQELGGRFGGAQLFDKIVVHQHLHHAGQHVNVQAAIFRRSDGKQQVGLAVVLGVVLHGCGQTHRGQAGAGHAGGAGVRYRDAVIHVGGRFGLAGVEGFFVGFAVGDVAVGGLQFHQPVDDLRLISCGLIQCNGLRSKQFCNTHSGSPSIYQIILSSFSIFAFVASPTLNAVALPQAVPRRSA